MGNQDWQNQHSTSVQGNITFSHFDSVQAYKGILHHGQSPRYNETIYNE